MDGRPKTVQKKPMMTNAIPRPYKMPAWSYQALYRSLMVAFTPKTRVWTGLTQRGHTAQFGWARCKLEALHKMHQGVSLRLYTKCTKEMWPGTLRIIFTRYFGAFSSTQAPSGACRRECRVVMRYLKSCWSQYCGRSRNECLPLWDFGKLSNLSSPF